MTEWRKTGRSPGGAPPQRHLDGIVRRGVLCEAQQSSFEFKSFEYDVVVALGAQPQRRLEGVDGGGVLREAQQNHSNSNHSNMMWL